MTWGGWRIPIGYQLVFRNAHEDFNYETPAQPPTADCETDVQEQQRLQSQYYRAILITPDGAEHELRPTDSYPTYGGTRPYLLNYYKDTPNTVNAPIRYYSFDGSYFYVVVNPSTSSTSWTVYMNDGTKVVQSSNGIQRITDTNGNSIKIFSDANGTHVQDELTTRELRFYDNKVWYQTVTGLTKTVDIVMGTTTVQGKLYQVNDWSPTGGETGGGFVCTRNEILPATSISVIREIVFPQTEPGVAAQRYSFSYNSDTTTANVTDDMRLSCGMPLEPYTRTVSNGMGELSQVVTPSGAVLKYNYSKSSIHNFSLDIDDIPRATVTQKQIIHDGITDTWTYNIMELAGCGGTVTAPDGSVIVEQCYPKDAAWAQFFGYATNKGGLSFRSRRSDREVVERHWTMLPFSGSNDGLTGAFGVNNINPVVDVEYVTLLDDTPNHSPLKMSAKKFQYDFNGNLTQEIDYDWFDPSLVSRDGVGVPTDVPVSATILRTTNYSHYNQATTASSTNVYAKRALSTVTPLILNALKQTTLGPSIVQFSYDGQAYDVGPTAGNLTSKRVWDDVDNKWITTSSAYDGYGNVASTTDGRGKVTQYFFDDSTHALPTRVVVDPQNGSGTQTTTTVYDTATGLITSVTDSNNVTSSIDYTNQLLGAVDPLGRPGVAIGPLVNAGGVNQHRRVTTTYEDHLRRIVVASDLNTENDKLLKTRTTADMLGRPILTEQTEDGTNYTLYSQQAYTQAGRVSFTSSVMRTGSSSNTDSWTRITNDNLGRVVEVATFGGATQPPNTGTTSTATGTVTTLYNANFTTVTDQAGKLRRSMVDPLGRLVRVDEPDASNNLGAITAPVQPTSYAYDVFGNLTTVTQGIQARTFVYDSLSRLRQATNPESGTIGYQYDDNGNLVVKSDARTVSTHFEYDALNRATRRWYNGSSSLTATTHNSPALPPSVGATEEARFYYDSQGLPTGAPSYSRGAASGRLVAQLYGSGTNGDYFAYDVLGRATLKFQQTGAINYRMSAAYTLAGAISTLNYPSDRSLTNSYDQAGRLTGLSGNLGDGAPAPRAYASGILYAPTGALVKEQFGTNTPVYNKLFYNSRGQLAEIRVSTSYTGPTDTNWNRGAIVNHYSYQCWGMCTGSGMTDNNGNLLKQDVYIPNDDQISGSTARWQQYDYDSLNRLNWVREIKDNVEQWKQQFVYDRYGNRTINGVQTWGTGINNKQFTVTEANNRLGVPAGQSGVMNYDAAGNLTNDTYTGAGNRTYDAENKITSAMGGNNQAQLYGYDGSGQRIKRTVDGVETWQVYGFGGELLAEYPANGPAASPQKEYGYRNGQLLVTAESVASAALNVQWTNVVNVTVAGNSLAKPANGNVAWDAGAVSTKAIASGDGYMEFNASESNTNRMAGLSHGDSNQDYADIDFAIYLFSDGNAYVFESGVSKANLGSYAVNDVFRVAVESGVVKYRRNGTSVYTSTAAPAYPLLVDTAMSIPGGTLNNVRLSGTLVEDVKWKNVINVTAAGNSLTKPVNGNVAWDAGAVSTKAIASGDGYMEFNASESNTNRMAGLSHGDSNQDYADIDFAIYLFSDGNAYVFESGVSKANLGSYAVNDLFRVAVESGVVKYRRNGTLVYTSAVAPVYPVLVDTAISIPGGTINSVRLSGTLVEEVQWTSAVNVTVSGNSLTKQSGGSAVWDAGAVSMQTIAGDGYVEFTVAEMNKNRMAGLSHGDSNQDYADIDYAWYAYNDGTLYVFEGGVSRGGFGTYTSGDRLRVAVEGGIVKYRKNGVLVYTSSSAPTYPLLVDTAFSEMGATVNDAVVNGASSVIAKINWLVTDHLGTPRMIIDETGLLTNVKRHDYLPFGEELFAPAGGRTTAQGYASGDGIRQQFAQKDRDIEIGDDYFEARYFASLQGRFTSTDPILASAKPMTPQSWNRYAYCINNPLKYIDPNGLDWYVLKGGDGHPQWFDDNPGDKYTRYNNTVYYAGATWGYVSLDPNSNHWEYGFQSENEARAYYVNSMEACDAVCRARADREEVWRNDPPFGGNDTAIDATWLGITVPFGGLSRAATPVTGTVWDSIVATQEVYEGTVIPRSFKLTTESAGRVWISGNATEHLAEFVLGRTINLTPDAAKLVGQIQLANLQGAINAAERMGIKYGELMKVGRWELVFAPPRAEGQLPAVIHALYK